MQIRAALALAGALGRALVLPQLWCGADRYWAPHKGTIPGSAFALPFRCPLDHVLDLEQCAALPSLCHSPAPFAGSQQSHIAPPAALLSGPAPAPKRRTQLLEACTAGLCARGLRSWRWAVWGLKSCAACAQDGADAAAGRVWAGRGVQGMLAAGQSARWHCSRGHPHRARVPGTHPTLITCLRHAGHIAGMHAGAWHT